MDTRTMIRGYKDLYKLWDLTELFIEKTNPDFDDIDKKKLGHRIKQHLFGGQRPSRYDSLDSKTKYWIDNFIYYTEILDSLERMYQAYAYICKFPRFRYYNFFRINEFSWIRYHLEFWLQEVYNLRERTIKWIKYLEEIAKHRLKNNSVTKLTKFRKLVDKVFEKNKIVRGSHVHERRFEPNDFTGIDLLNLLISKGKLKDLIPLRVLGPREHVVLLPHFFIIPSI